MAVKRRINMGKLSVKLKITLWYTGILIAVSAVVLAAMTSISTNVLNRDIMARVAGATDRLSKEMENGRDIRKIPGFKYYEQGVHMVLIDGSGNVIGGQIPYGISDNLSAVSDGMHSEAHNGSDYYVFDKTVRGQNGEEYCLKGFAPVSEGTQTVKSMARSNAVLITVMIIIAALGGYIIIGKILKPINRIRQTAEEISESSDLSQRLGLPPGSDEFHRLAESFDKMLGRLEQTMEREKQFTSDASHELRTPVAAILSSCEFMASYAKNYEDMKEAAEGIQREAQRMSKLISELLTISRMDSNTIKAEPESVDMGELAEFVCDEQADIHSGGSITLHKNFENNVIVKGDRYMLARLCINLVSNAYSYGRDGGNITVSVSHRDGNAVLSVADDGAGISKEDLPKIWERFYRADPSRTDNGGAGLGLSMVKWIAQYHGGTVSAESELKCGSVFTFTMPAE